MSVDAAAQPAALDQKFVAAVQRRFAKQGYLCFDGALTQAEVAAANDALDTLELPTRGDLRPLIDKGDVFLEHLVHQRVLPYVLALLGGNIVVMGSCCTVIPPGAGSMVWHEDGPRPWPYPEVDGKRAFVTLRVGIFLEDLTETNRGNLVVLPGSHLRPFHEGGERSKMASLPGVRPLLVKAGSVVMFHNALWHSTAPNTMDHDRRALYYGFAPSWHRIVDYIVPPPHLVEAVERHEQPRRSMLSQLIGLTPPSGAPGFYFPESSHFPGLSLIEPPHRASGYD